MASNLPLSSLSVATSWKSSPAAFFAHHVAGTLDIRAQLDNFLRFNVSQTCYASRGSAATVIEYAAAAAAAAAVPPAAVSAQVSAAVAGKTETATGLSAIAPTLSDSLIPASTRPAFYALSDAMMVATRQAAVELIRSSS